MILDHPLFFEINYLGQFVRIDIIQITHPFTVENDWSKFWIQSKVSLKAGAFSAEYNCDLTNIDFINFKNDFSKLYEHLDGNASFNTIENQIKIDILGSGYGRFEATCRAVDFVGTGNELVFTIQFDQTIIPPIIIQLENIIKQFPS